MSSNILDMPFSPRQYAAEAVAKARARSLQRPDTAPIRRWPPTGQLTQADIDSMQDQSYRQCTAARLHQRAQWRFEGRLEEAEQPSWAKRLLGWLK